MTKPSKRAQAAARAKSASAEQDGSVLDRVSQHAMEKVENTFKNSPTFNSVSSRLDAFPKFSQKEVSRGRVLGRGQYGIVKELSQVQLVLDNEKAAKASNISAREASSLNEYYLRRRSNAEIDKRELENRQFIAEHCKREGKDARYAIKRLSEEVMSDVNLFFRAATDLALETYILSTLEHNNIIKMRGMAIGDICSPNYFIVMDRLYDTLERRVLKWKKLDGKYNGVKGKLFDSEGKKKRQLLDDKLTVAFDLAAALGYMHSLDIMHRDIKPDNIGFDVRGDVKIFDFGLARELRKELEVENGLFKLTGCTGSLRYMAPEVYKEQPYNHGADVYSFAILLWEILYTEKPFPGFSRKMLVTQVFEQGCRPKPKKEVTSQKLILLMTRCWAASISERMSAHDCSDILKKELANLRSEQDVSKLDITHMKRRSTFIAPRGTRIQSFPRSIRKLVTR